MNPIKLGATPTATPVRASEMMKMAENAPSASEPQDKVETGFWADVKGCARKGADISSHALGGFAGLTLAGLGVYVGALGGTLGGAYLGGGLGLLKAAAGSEGFLGFWKTAFTTAGGGAKLGLLTGGASVGYGSWKMGEGAGSVLAAIPGAIIGGAVGVGVAIRNKLTGGGE